jgi:hypothetical protein
MIDHEVLESLAMATNVNYKHKVTLIEKLPYEQLF